MSLVTEGLALSSEAYRRADKLTLSCGLKVFPKEIYSLADSLEFLDLSGNDLTELPDDFSCLKNLKILFLSQNQFTEFPKVLANCLKLDIIGFKANRISSLPEDAIPENLRWLILTDNQLTKLPKSIGKCSRLQKLMLAGNSLTSLPSEMAACKNLQLLRISSNRFENIPNWLFSLPKLSWLAFAGNPCSSFKEKRIEILEIPWHDLEIKELLGAGASGSIHQAVLLNKEGESVAVKIFKGAVTSDGLPSDEMNAAILAGDHSQLITVIGKISEHPTQMQGLVLKLISKTYENLGLPPDYDTCTRDTYPSDLRFSLQEVVKILKNIASAALHLHARGIMHGDLYAHNILIEKDSTKSLFGDFGAATRYEIGSELAPSLERIEVRAFGCLMEDLLSLVAISDQNGNRFKSLDYLKQDCMGEIVLDRPSFEEISRRI